MPDSFRIYYCGLPHFCRAPTWYLAQEDPAVLPRALPWIDLPEYLLQLTVDSDSGLSVLSKIDPLEYLLDDRLPHLLVVGAVVLLPPPLF